MTNSQLLTFSGPLCTVYYSVLFTDFVHVCFDMAGWPSGNISSLKNYLHQQNPKDFLRSL